MVEPILSIELLIAAYDRSGLPIVLLTSVIPGCYVKNVVLFSSLLSFYGMGGPPVPSDGCLRPVSCDLDDIERAMSFEVVV